MHCAIAFEPGSARSDLTPQRQLGEFCMTRIRLKAFEKGRYRHLASPIFHRPLAKKICLFFNRWVVNREYLGQKLRILLWPLWRVEHSTEELKALTFQAYIKPQRWAD